MTPEDSPVSPETGAPSTESLADCVRRGLGLSNEIPVRLTEIGEFSNINYVYWVETPVRTLYLKVVPERPKRLIANLARERVFSEAEGLRCFRRLAQGAIVIPEVLFVDEREMALAMSDVGQGREVLFGVLGEHFDLLGAQAEALGNGLGLIHGGTRGQGTPRPAAEEAVIRQVIFEGLLAPGASKVFPDTWPALKAEMLDQQNCLVHADLWSKNLLVRDGQPVAVVDFEGVFYGDPSFDLATLAAVALLPALDKPALMVEALAFISRLLLSWSSACGSQVWAAEVLPRTFRATACFLAARTAGPFPYLLSPPGQERINGLATSLSTSPPLDLDHFRARVTQSAGSGEAATRGAQPPRSEGDLPS